MWHPLTHSHRVSFSTVNMTPPQVRVSIISEAQANHLLKNDKTMNEHSGDILNNTGTMEYHAATRQLSVNFRNMQVRNRRLLFDFDDVTHVFHWATRSCVKLSEPRRRAPKA